MTNDTREALRNAAVELANALFDLEPTKEKMREHRCQAWLDRRPEVYCNFFAPTDQSVWCEACKDDAEVRTEHKRLYKRYKAARRKTLKLVAKARTEA